jgi:HEAT repeat protein
MLSRMRVPTVRLALGAAATLATVVAGCTSPTGSGSDEWSTRGRSAASGNVTDQPTPAGRDRFSGPVSETPVGVTERAERTPTPPADPVTPLVDVDRTALRARAVATLEETSRDSWSLIRANTIEALIPAGASLDGPAKRGLVDDNRGVRFVAALAIGKARRCELSHLTEPLLNDADLSVRAAALATQSLCGRNPDLAPLASMVASEDPEVRGNAFLVLGLIGNRSAVPLIRDSLGRGLAFADAARVKVVELQAAEALVRLGQRGDIEPIRAALFGPAEMGGVTALACQMIGELKDAGSRPMLERLVLAQGDQVRAPEIRLAALTALGRLGDTDPAKLLAEIRPLVGATRGELRAQAATALGSSGSREALGYLAVLLGDAEPMVRTAAAGGIVRFLAVPGNGGSEGSSGSSPSNSSGAPTLTTVTP